MSENNPPEPQEPNGLVPEDPSLQADRKLPLHYFGALGAALVVGVLLVTVVLGGGSDDSSANPTSGSSAGLATGEPTPVATIDIGRPTAVAPNPTAVEAGDKLVIAKFGISEQLALKTVGPDGQMPDPSTPDEIAYYNFSNWPGLGGAPGRGGNAIFSGHVDSGTKPCDHGRTPPPCTAVFFQVPKLQKGDVIEVHLSGVVHKYAVATNESVSATTGPWDKIVAATAQETITLITCGGTFNQATREYSNRQVVTAVRI